MEHEKKLPNGWTYVRLGEFVVSEKGKKPKAVSTEKSYTFCLPYVNIQAFEKNIISEYTDGDGCVICEDNDFLMVWDGSRSGYAGKAIKGALGSTLVKINFPGILNDYAYYFLKSKYIEINTKAKGTGTPHVDPSLLWNYIFPIPPLSEQHRIIAKIEELFSELDKGVESLKAAQQQLKVYRQAVLKWAFEGKLTEEWRYKRLPKYPAYMAAATTTDKYQFDGEDNVCLPPEWRWTKLGDFADTIKIGPFGTLLHKADYIQNGVPVINPKHINSQRILPDDKVTVSIKKANELYSYKLMENDIILGRRGEMGRSAYVSAKESGWICGTGTMIIRLKKNNLGRLYSLILAQKSIKEFLEKNCTGTTMNNLNEKIVKGISLPIIPDLEQHQIIHEIESRLSVCDKMEETIEQSLAQAESLRQSILKKAFEGKLVPQDPNDEAADKLLERIRAEREAQKPSRTAAKGRTKK